MPMSKENNILKDKSPESIEKIKEKIQIQTAETIKFCTGEHECASFYSIEKEIMKMVAQLGCLFLQLFLMVQHERLNYEQWLSTGLYYAKIPVSRVLKTVYGEITYWRLYLARKKGGGGFYPLDSVLGLTSDGFTPLIISLVTKLATRVSFQTSVLFFHCFYGWAPSTESIENLVLGLGRYASNYMELVEPPKDEGIILVIECDGKAPPMATEEELGKRRGKRKKKYGCKCGCQRHRGKSKRQFRNRKMRKKGDKSKNGRSSTLVVMYTLKKGSDGKLHGPCNKKVWASFAPRKAMFAWARRQATKRGFPPDTDKRIHILVDGEPCLHDRLAELFPHATFALDIRHLEEKLWDTGHIFYSEGSEELKAWVEEKRTLLYTGRIGELILQLKTLQNSLSKRAKRDESKYKSLAGLIKYMEPRVDMMNYKQYIDEDLPIATGIVEGAARYVVGERMDCAGMRWIPGRAEALLQLRCIELNGDWDHFFDWSYNRWLKKLQEGEKVMVRSEEPIDLSLYTQEIELLTRQNDKGLTDAA